MTTLKTTTLEGIHASEATMAFTAFRQCSNDARRSDKEESARL